MSTFAQIDPQKRTARFRHVLIATDFSPIAERALAYALPIARRYGSEVSIVHAIRPEPQEPITWDPLPVELDRERMNAEREMGRLAQQARVQDLHPHLSLHPGPVWEVLSSVIQREDVDLLVLGTHGRGGLKKLALGSVAEEVLRQAACPVLTIGPHVPPPDPAKAQFRSVLFATDFGPASANAFPYALALAEDCQAKLILLHLLPMTPVDVVSISYCPGPCAVEQLMDWKEAQKEVNVRRLKTLVPPDASLPQPPEFIVGTELLPEGILSIAETHHVDLIVMGATRSHSARAVAHMPWALAHGVVCKAKCPVLTVCG